MARKRTNLPDTPDLTIDDVLDGYEPMDEIPYEDAIDNIVFDNPFDEEAEPSDFDIPTEALDHAANLAAFIPDQELVGLSQYCSARYTDDYSSMEDYREDIASGLQRLGIKIEELNDPFPGACSVQHPLVLESAIKMQAKIMNEVFNGRPLVDVRLSTGAEPEMRDIGVRGRDYMNYQYMREFKEYAPETERLALRYSMTGNAYRKYYYDDMLARTRSQFQSEDALVVNTKETTLEFADFYTEESTFDRHRYEGMIDAGVFIDPRSGQTEPTDQELQGSLLENYLDEVVMGATGDPMGTGATACDKFPVRFHYVTYKLPEPYNENVNHALPYIIAVDVTTDTILSIRRNWRQDDPRYTKRVWHSHYKLVPGLGFFGWGYIHLLGNPQMALTMMLRSLIDAGQFANLQGGFKDSRVKFSKQGQLPLGPGQFIDIDMTQAVGMKEGATVGDALHFFDFKEPSQVLERMVGFLDGRIQKFADSTEAVIGDSTNYGPVGTTVALIEASAKFHTDILKRFHRTLEDEFQILAALNFDTLDEQVTYWWKGEEKTVQRADFDGRSEFITTADPSFSSQAQRLQKANAKLQAAQLDTSIHNMKEAFTGFYRELGLEQDEIDKLLPPDESAVEQDPMSDIISLTKGKPVAAFAGQDHQAHIDFKTAFLDDPQAGGSPAFQAYASLLQANIIEHGLQKYMEQMQSLITNNGGNPADAFAQSQAATKLTELHQMEQNEEALKGGDPTAILAKTEQKKAEIAEKRLLLDERKLDDDASDKVTKNQLTKRGQDIDVLTKVADAKHKVQSLDQDLVKHKITARTQVDPSVAATDGELTEGGVSPVEQIISGIAKVLIDSQRESAREQTQILAKALTADKVLIKDNNGQIVGARTQLTNH